MKKHLIIILIMLGLAALLYPLALKPVEGISVEKESDNYSYAAYGRRIWYAPSLREGSLSGGYRGGGPGAGK